MSHILSINSPKVPVLTGDKQTKKTWTSGMLLLDISQGLKEMLRMVANFKVYTRLEGYW